MTLELYLDGVSDCALIHYAKDQASRPDVIRLGSGDLFRFYRFCKPKGPGRTGCLYRRATVVDFNAIHLEAK